jgi:type IV secretion system protein VirB6
MTICTDLTENASAGVAPALRAVDCLANETTSAAFGRLFGTNGALLPALTIVLTLYIAFFAFSLLTGRSRLGISALTPRMMTLGLVLTFATSWVAYQGVVWNLAIGAPDQIAGVLMGAKGSATQLFGDRIDMIFAALAEIAQSPQSGAGQAGAQQVPQNPFGVSTLIWLAALLLLLGTIGILVTARIALAVLLALGPVFVVFALFPGTRGLTAGWLRAVVMTAVTPLFVVLGGGIMLELVVPVVGNLQGATGVDGRAALALFMVASVHVALMAMAMKVTGSIVGGWRVFGLVHRDAQSAQQTIQLQTAPVAGQPAAASSGTAATFVRRPVFTGTAATPPMGFEAPAARSRSFQSSRNHTVTTQTSDDYSPIAPFASARARGIGSRFRARPRQVREISR